MIADKAAAQPIAAMVSAHVNADVLSGLNPDDMGYPKAAGAEAVRLGAYALVRLGSYDGLASAFLDSNGRPRSRWWPIAYAFQRVNDPRSATVLLDLFNGEGQLTRAFAARGLGASKDQRAAGLLVKAAEDAGQPLAVRIQAVRGVALLGDPDGGAAMRRLITVTTGRSEPAARSDHRAGAVARSGRDRPADRSGVRAVAVGARGRAARLVEAGCRHIHRFDLRARSRPAMVGSRRARDARSAICRAIAHRRR